MFADIHAATTVPLDEVSPDPRNARRHGSRNLAAIKESLTRFGQVKPIVVARSTGHVVAGNGTLQAAQELGWASIAVVYVDGTEAELRALALADNRTAELAEWDYEELAAQVEELGTDAVVDLGWSDSELDLLLKIDWAENPPQPGALLPFPGAAAIGALDTTPTTGSAPALPTAAPYTEKKLTPIYVPRGDLPAVADLCDTTRTTTLLTEIAQADLPDDLRVFLHRAAERHTRFDFRKIAEFYAHATPEVQALFEASALVVIDFDAAIERGFVLLNDRMMEILDREVELGGTSEQPEDDDAAEA